MLSDAHSWAGSLPLKVLVRPAAVASAYSSPAAERPGGAVSRRCRSHRALLVGAADPATIERAARRVAACDARLQQRARRARI
eukprot:5565442-Prymnesium_polylepis.1